MSDVATSGEAAEPQSVERTATQPRQVVGVGASAGGLDALERTYAAAPDPKWVVAAGDCAGSCGVFAGSYACVGPVSAVIPVDLHIAGCPPQPIELLKGLIGLMDAASR